MSMTENRSPSTTIGTAEVQALISADPNARLVDVRTAGEYQTAHIEGSINLPLDQLDANTRQIVSGAPGPVVLVCQAGGRAEQAHRKLVDAGLTRASVLTGGMNGWTAAGAPVERSGEERWGLERQVRLVAGSIVLVSVLASIWVPAIRFVAGAVGAGLVFAAVSNTCMMGMALAKLPYNRGPATDADAAVARITSRANADR